MNDEQQTTTEQNTDATTIADATTTTPATEQPPVDQADGHGTTEPEQAEAKEGAAV